MSATPSHDATGDNSAHSLHRLVRRRGVHRLLVTGTDDQRADFHVRVCMTANLIEQRGQTIFYTVMAEDLNVVVEFAKAVGLTVQQHADKEPWWPVVVAGTAPPWTPNVQDERRLP